MWPLTIAILEGICKRLKTFQESTLQEHTHISTEHTQIGKESIANLQEAVEIADVHTQHVDGRIENKDVDTTVKVQTAILTATNTDGQKQKLIESGLTCAENLIERCWTTLEGPNTYVLMVVTYVLSLGASQADILSPLKAVTLVWNLCNRVWTLKSPASRPRENLCEETPAGDEILYSSGDRRCANEEHAQNRQVIREGGICVYESLGDTPEIIPTPVSKEELLLPMITTMSRLATASEPSVRYSSLRCLTSGLLTAPSPLVQQVWMKLLEKTFEVFGLATSSIDDVETLQAWHETTAFAIDNVWPPDLPRTVAIVLASLYTLLVVVHSVTLRILAGACCRAGDGMCLRSKIVYTSHQTALCLARRTLKTFSHYMHYNSDQVGPHFAPIW